MTYRADIDGLRAVAVLSVVLFHAFPGLLPGGFTGVDVFFVISGYLISSIISSAIERGRFSFAEFYGARIRRIFPSLILVLSFCVLVGAISLSRDEFDALNWHVVAGSFFFSNFAYWQQSGYFDTASQAKPLLHLWSLAVEEQFYLIWPIVLLLVRNRARAFTAVVLIACAVSFAANLALTIKFSPWFDPATGYFLPLSRFWEIMMGAAIASPSMIRPSAAKHLLEKCSWIGAGLVVLGLVITDEHRAYPSIWALLPTCGAVLLIAAGKDAWFNKHILSNPALVQIGLISYPFYLWHWPLLSFLRIYSGEVPSSLSRLLAIGLALCLAWLSWKFVELPVRFTRIKQRAAMPLASGIVILGLLGLVISVKGVASPVSQVRDVERGDIEHDAFHAYLKKRYVPCGPSQFLASAPAWKGVARCYQSHSLSPRTVAILGDSHAEHIFPGLANKFGGDNFVYYETPTLSQSDGLFRSMIDYVKSDENIRTIILMQFWSQTIDENTSATVYADLKETIETLVRHRKHVIVLQDPPDFPWDPSACKYKRPLTEQKCSMAAPKFLADHEVSRAVIAKLGDLPGVTIVDPVNAFCDNHSCYQAMGGMMHYRDRNHLSIEGSDFLANSLKAHHGASAILSSQ